MKINSNAMRERIGLGESAVCVECICVDVIKWNKINEISLITAKLVVYSDILTRDINGFWQLRYNDGHIVKVIAVFYIFEH